MFPRALPVACTLAAAALLAACGSYGTGSAAKPAATTAMADTPTRTQDGVLIGPSGMTLYTFDRDTAGNGMSVCNGPCATNWPPLAAPAMGRPMGDYTVVKRDDGTMQWAYKGRPLYYWSKDMKAGDRTGDGFNNSWRVARP